MSQPINVRRGTTAQRNAITLGAGEPGWDTDTKRFYVGDGTTVGGIYIGGSPSTVDFSIYMASAALGGRPASAGASGLIVATGSSTAVSASKLVDGAANFPVSIVGKTVYNKTQDLWAKVTARDSATQLSLSADIFTGAAGRQYDVADALDNLQDLFNAIPNPFFANVTLQVSPGTFSGDAEFGGKVPSGTKAITLKTSASATTFSGNLTLRQRMSVTGTAGVKLSLSGNVKCYAGCDITWTYAQTTGAGKFFIYGTAANVFNTCTITIGNDPQGITNISSTITTGYTSYVTTPALGGSDATGDGLAITSGMANGTTASKLIDSTANFTSAVLNKPVYNSTDDTWAQITAVDSATQLSLSADIFVSGEGYVISNAFSTPQKAVDMLPAIINCNTAIKVSNGTFTGDTNIQNKGFSGSYNLTLQGTLSLIDTGAAGASVSSANFSAGTAAHVKAVLNDTSKAWVASAHIGKLLIITGGTGAGQERVIYDNTATQLKIVGTWDIAPNTTSSFKIVDWATSLVGSTTAAINQKNQVNLAYKYFKIDGGALANCVFIHDFSYAEFYSCLVTGGSNTANMLYCAGNVSIKINTAYILAPVGAIAGNVGLSLNGGISTVYPNTIQNLWIKGASDGASISSMCLTYIWSCLIEASKRWGVRCQQFATFDVMNTVITGSTTYNLYLSAFGNCFQRGGCEYSSAGSHGMLIEGNSYLFYSGGSFIASNGGWGLNTTLNSYGKSVSLNTYSGNVSGTYTADASSNNS